MSRLQAAGHVTSVDRGRWQLTPSAMRLARQVARWRHRETRLWTGGWLGIATGGLGRTDRTAARRRDRALSLFGCRELSPGLFVRPDNLADALEAVRDELVALGLEGSAPVFEMSALGPAQDTAMALWDTAALTGRYHALQMRLTDVSKALSDWPLEQAAREAFAAGSDVLRHLAFDPLLPEVMLDPFPRQALVAQMGLFDDAARALWRHALNPMEVP